MTETKTQPTHYTVLVQEWEESERGWGTRPDGYSVHLSHEDRDKYVSGYNETFNNLDEAPDEYTRVSGDPYVGVVPAVVFHTLQANAARTEHAHSFQAYGRHYSDKLPPKADRLLRPGSPWMATPQTDIEKRQAQNATEKIEKLVLNFFNGDKKKTALWFTTENPLLGGMPPRDLVDLGRADKLLKIIETSLAKNRRDS